jgi:hypothetical protein
LIKQQKRTGRKYKAQALLDILEVGPLQNPPPFEKLVDNLNTK